MRFWRLLFLPLAASVPHVLTCRMDEALPALFAFLDFSTAMHHHGFAWIGCEQYEVVLFPGSECPTSLRGQEADSCHGGRHEAWKHLTIDLGGFLEEEA